MKSICKRILSGTAAAAALTLTAAEPVQITVDATQVVAPVNPLALGANIEAADDRGIFDRPLSAAINPGSVAYAEGTWNPATNQPQSKVIETLKAMRVGMMRYPGGCLAHNYNWKHAVGALSERPDWKFGLDEYIELCRALNAEPLFTLTDYALPLDELPQHMAELVEYLNAPAIPKYPWAMKRAQWGHEKPYGVKYFELGNETDHGNHNVKPRRQYTPEEYVTYFTECAAAMRKIDPTIQLGIVLVPGTGENYDCAWNRTVLKEAGKLADFIVIHFYAPGVDNQTPENALAATLAYGDQVEYRLMKYRELSRELVGKVLPLAMTEYNIGSTANEPQQYRFSFLAGLMNADLQRIWQKPENGILTANYWQIVNGYWGSFVTDNAGETVLRRATMPFFEVWGKYCGTEVVTSTVTGAPRISAAAIPGLAVSAGDRVAEPEPIGEAKLPEFSFDKFPAGISAFSKAPGELTVKLDKFNRKEGYPVFATLPRPADAPRDKAFTYVVSFDAKFTPTTPGERPSAAFGLGLVDQRGWDATFSAASISGVHAARTWEHFSGQFQVLADTPGTDLLFRIEGVSAPVSGTVEFKNLKMEMKTPLTFPAYCGLTSIATRSEDGKTLYLIVFNKDPKQAIATKVDLKNFATDAGTGVVLASDKPETVEYTAPKPFEVKVGRDGSFSHTFPAASMTALEFKLK